VPTPAIESAFLRVESLTKSFRHEPVLRGLSLTLGQHHTLSVLGRSGCGKTTFLKALAGLIDIDGGELFLGEQRLNDLRPQRRHVVYLYQEPLLFPHLNVFENVVFGLRLRRVNEPELKARAEELIESLELTAHTKKMPSQLSGGQRQRVAFGRALIIKPALLLLDEPFSNLDPEIRASMQQLFKRVARELAITSIFVTHDLKESLLVGDRFAHLAEGRLHLYETREDFIADPRTGVGREIDFWSSIGTEALHAGG
jgi:putrescine transport system ATP-binding protein